MNVIIKKAIVSEKALKKGTNKQDLEALSRNLKDLIDYSIKLEKRIDKLENPPPEKYY